jgi:hypothetical protein
MSSTSVRQSIVLLSVIGGSLARINSCRMFSVVSMKQLVRDTQRRVIVILDSWPEDEHSHKDSKWANERVDEWGKLIVDVKDRHNLPVFSKMCSRCLEDLKTVIKNKRKLELLQTLNDPIQKIVDFVDPNGENFQAFEKADVIMDELYQLIKWEWK